MAEVETRREAAARRWRGAAFGTMVMQLSYLPLLLIWQAAFGGADIDRSLLGQALGFGLGVMPLVFITVAFASRHPRAPIAVLKAMGLCIVFGGPALMLTPILGVAAGYGAGGIVALRRDRGLEALQFRIAAVGSVVLLVVVLVLLVPLAGAIAAGLGPLLAVAYADHLIDKRHPPEADEDAQPIA